MKNDEYMEKPDRLKNLFGEMDIESPSEYFLDNLMSRIEQEAHANRRKKQFSFYLSVIAGIAGILILPALIFYVIGIEFSGLHLNVDLQHIFKDVFSIFNGINLDPRLIIIALIILILLMGDTLVRKFVKVD